MSDEYVDDCSSGTAVTGVEGSAMITTGSPAYTLVVHALAMRSHLHATGYRHQ